ncbi:MAG TPA: selenium metabolism-associated LysR family transcriptional regulator [Bacillota bacterium]|nr:selenium metabolism-associated LysR family transcriptional regulator [Bacillota bacterium]
MNIKQLEALVRVAETGSFTKAAKLLFLTQPAISFQIRTLEEQLGIRLLERADRTVVLTEAGKQVCTEARAILNSYNSINQHVAEFKGLTKGTLSLGASTIPGEYLLPQFLGEFKQIYHGIDFRMEIGSTRQIIGKVLDRQIHLAVVGAVQEHADLEYVPLFTDEVVVIAGVKHPLAQLPKLEVSQLVNEDFILREQGSGTRSVAEQKFLEAGIDPEKLRVVMELGSTRAIITAVQGNLGIGLVSGLAAYDALRLNLVKRLELGDLDMHRRLYMVTNSASLSTPLQNAFAQFLELKRKGE